MLKNTSFEWTIITSSNYIFINEFITYMVLNFKHVKHCDQYWHLSPKDFQQFPSLEIVWVLNDQLYQILLEPWRLLADSNLLKRNIFLKALFQQTESWRTGELVKRRAPIQYRLLIREDSMILAVRNFLETLFLKCTVLRHSPLYSTVTLKVS